MEEYKDNEDTSDHGDVEYVGFGLAQVKEQGMTFCLEDPSIKPWDGCGKEFEDYFKTKYPLVSKIPLIGGFFKKTIRESWDDALLTNARLNN